MGKPVDDRIVEFVEVVVGSEIPLITQPFVTTVFDVKDNESGRVQYFNSYQVTYCLKDANGVAIPDDEGNPLLKTEYHETPYTDVPQEADAALNELSANIPQWKKDDYLKWTGKVV